jgi:RimJ/RimL family protein N-acetyltransferase
MKSPDLLPLDTPRLVLRRFSDGDVDAFLAYRNDPEVIRYEYWTGCTAVEAAEYIRHQQVQEAGVPGEWLQIAIALKATNQLIGDCGVRVHPADSRQATIGVALARAWHGRGFAFEALSCVFDFLFRQRALHRLVVDTDAENIAMQRLAERLGMRREGHLRQSLWFKGRWADELFYALLRDEWLARDEPKQISLKTTP